MAGSGSRLRTRCAWSGNGPGICPPVAIVTDPFSGTGTTALAAAEHGCEG